MRETTFEHIAKHIDRLEIDYDNGLILNRKPLLNECGYYRVYIGGKYVLVHNIIAFIKYGTMAVGSLKHVQCNHMDGNKLNNRPENIFIVSARTNIRHAYGMNLINVNRGEKNHKATINEDIVRDILHSHLAGVSRSVIAVKHGISNSVVQKLFPDRHGVMFRYISTISRRRTITM